jgi:acetyltransferase-like isoleucine patch superfamily enzyme
MFQKIKYIIYKYIKYIPFWSIDRCNQLIHGIQLFFIKKQKGHNSYIDNTVHITGWKYISIGNYTIISENSWLNVNQRVAKFIHIKIGNNCYIGRRNFFSAGKSIIIGDYFMTGIDCKFIGSDHIYDNPLKPYSITETTNNKSIVIGVNVRFGAGVVVIGNVNIGYGSVIGAGALVNRNIPPFSIVVGNPCRIIKRFNFTLNKWIKADMVIAEEDLCLPDEDNYLNILKAQYPIIYIPRQAASKKYGDMV